ncbi:hypothetical protein BLNAU_3408 [Blattamonas nauphoetae]|uniref:Uncharacterized protein n=1 Tax=Blattamonas nauphoetae TaxID=2049346 RepID=A0ABQ9YD32_9EUKA|nr:hypothetical protein BLNAU_3408 [Blattamonas nauphoetae]
METHIMMVMSVSKPIRSVFLNWDGHPVESSSERSAIYKSFIQVVKNKHSFTPSLEDKASSFLEQISPKTTNEVDSIINDIVPSSQQESSSAFVESKLVSSLDLFSPSFTEAEKLHNNLIGVTYDSLMALTERVRDTLQLHNDNEQQELGETVYCQVLLPLEAYIRYICSNRYSLVDGELPASSMLLLAKSLAICPYHEPTMRFVFRLPILPTIPSAMTFYERDIMNLSYRLTMLLAQLKYTTIGGETLNLWNIILRSQRMEGVEDLDEQRLNLDFGGAYGHKVAERAIEWNNLLGMNVKSPK